MNIRLCQINQSGLTKAQKSILRYLVSLGSNHLYAGLSGIAKRLRFDERTVRRAFRVFESLGVLTLLRAEQFGRLPRVYRINPEAFDTLQKQVGKLKNGAALVTEMSPLNPGHLSPLKCLGDIVPPECPRIHQPVQASCSSQSPGATPMKVKTVGLRQAKKPSADAFFIDSPEALQ